MIQDYNNLFSLEGKHALVTGGAQGLGLSIAEAFCAAGAVVTVADINAEAVEKTAEELRAQGGKAFSVVCDVSKEEQVAKAINDCAEKMGGLEIVVANAGVSVRAPAEEMTLEQWSRVIDIDLKGVFLCDREAGRYMLAHKGGSIINMSSIIGIVGNTTGNSNYAAAKGGVSSMTKVMAVEWAQRGIRVNAIAPGQTATKLIEGLMEASPDTRKYFEAHIPMGRLGKPCEIASAALFLASDATSFVTGQTIAVDGGITIAF
ncbi:SDR family NAD(P)-dependent oxidoreductase [Oscillibacter sp.]|uniref:SDR family NAD(P)-dependent oxidoreductase n=1 Tax=Oscillibacter sp. TaxID=1945593 RepID=UPI002618C6D8|nr:SDR family NAD(P)-dependent oxidoreductase [Oscillibacter sp.]MDD3346189.1 SDR family NAD(P)-dependent oxidoreductase [Oscillibacter sp.]